MTISSMLSSHQEANQSLGMTTKGKYRVALCKPTVEPHLEYGTLCWSPHL